MRKWQWGKITLREEKKENIAMGGKEKIGMREKIRETGMWQKGEENTNERKK